MVISIITSCYNRATTIRTAVESVLAQDYNDIEYIIVDGASRDNTMAVVRNCLDGAKHIGNKDGVEILTLNGKTIKIISEPDRGMYEALNKGIRCATGEIIGMVHSDDFLYSNTIISEIAAQIQRTNADLLYGDGLYIDCKKPTKIIRNWVGGEFSKSKVRHGWLPLHPTCYIRRDVMMREGLYDESYEIASDSELLVRYLLKADLKITYLHKYVIKMRMGGMSTNPIRSIQMWEEDLRLYRQHGMNPRLTKLKKMAWKVPQFVSAFFMNIRNK